MEVLFSRHPIVLLLLLKGLLVTAWSPPTTSAWRPPVRASASRARQLADPLRASSLDDGPDLDPLLRELAALEDNAAALGDSERSLLHAVLGDAELTRGGTGGRDDAWRWTESPSSVTFEVELPAGARARDVVVDVSAREIELACHARDRRASATPTRLLSGRFGGDVLHEDVAWTVEADDERATLFVELNKRSVGLWRDPLFSDHFVANKIDERDGAEDDDSAEHDGLVEVEDRVGFAPADAADAPAARAALSASNAALQAAASDGRAEDVVAILAAGRDAEHAGDPAAAAVDVDARDRWGAGATALLQAADFGHGATVDALLAAGADPTLRDVDGQSAADWAAHEGHDDLAEKLGRATEAWTGDSR